MLRKLSVVAVTAMAVVVGVALIASDDAPREPAAILDRIRIEGFDQSGEHIDRTTLSRTYVGPATVVDADLVTPPPEFRLSALTGDDHSWETAATWTGPGDSEGEKCDLLLQVPRSAARVAYFFSESEMRGYEEGSLSLIQMSANCFEAASSLE
jgi:hypothetical protein